MKKFKALKANGLPIITVIAEDESDAKVKIREQLRRPGRFEYFETWSIGGFKIKLQEESEEVKRILTAQEILASLTARIETYIHELQQKSDYIIPRSMVAEHLSEILDTMDK